MIYRFGRLLPSFACLLLAGGIMQHSTAFAQGCSNPVSCENANPGDTDWNIDGAGDLSIQGFATDISYKPGDTVSFKIKTDASNYTLAIYRMGYYNGAGARRVTTSFGPSVSLPQTQPPCLTDTNTNLIDCGSWAVSATWQVPSSAVSGLYFALLTRPDTGGKSQIFFVVRDDTRHSDILYVTSDETWQAYNDYGGHSLYGGAGVFDLNNRAYKVSYNRPFDTRNFEAATFLFNAEYPMIRFLEANGYDVSYFTDVDAIRNASLLTNHKILISNGHDEYVSLQRRTNLEAARDAGVNLAFFSGNEVFWKTRWENSTDGTNTPYRTLVCYKETYYGTGQAVYQKDPSDPPTWTGTWRDPRFSPPADGGRPENALTGTIFMVNGPGQDNTDLSIQVPAADGKMRFWRNTSVATQSQGQVATLPAGTLGYEWDGDVDNGARPAGLIPLSSATYSLTTDLLLDYGATYGAGNFTHHATLYRAPSGALVFGAGTVQWAWGLDSNHDGGGNNTADVRMQQATVNLFADMGVQPATLQSGLSTATKSTDTTAPTVAITSPAPGSSVPYGSAITISGTAADAGGGVVGAVEVSLDGGATWHPATGREQWSYSWSPYAAPGSNATIMARAVDDSGNLQTTASSASYSVSGEPSCPCSLWSSSATPAHPAENDSNAVEVGVKFRSDVAGKVTGVRFYKGTTNTGTHVGHLWTLQGSLLGSVTFTGETASGWQQANFSSPIAISANTTYVVSYYAPNGNYADDEPYFSGQGVDNPPLHSPATGTSGGNGLFVYTTGGGFPTGTYNAGNYWVDVVFSIPSPWSISGTITGASGVTVTLSGAGNASTTTDGSGNFTFANVQNGSYTVTPSKNGFAFTPANQNVTVNGASVSGVNFTATSVPTYTISGNAGTPGAAVTLSGAQAGNVTADSLGNYAFTVTANGSYTVTPSKSHFTFSPASQNVTVNGASISGVNFTASGSDSIWDDSATPVTPAANDSASVELGLKFRSDVAGLVTGVRFYKAATNTGTHLGNLWTSTGTKLATVTFSGETASGWQQALFASPVSIAANTTYVVSYYAPNGNYASDLNFFSNNGVDSPPLHALQDGVDGPNGVFVYGTSAFPTGSYTVTPSKTGFAISPASQNVTISGSNVTGVNFTATSNATYGLSGTITGGPAVTVTLTGAANASTTTDGSGNYSFSGLANGAYTVTPSRTGFTFTPANQNISINGANVNGVNFTAQGPPTFTISGSAGTAAATVNLTGSATASVTADSSGNFSFPGLANGTYTVTPSRTGFAFTPASQNVTVNGASVNGVNFTATGADSIWSSTTTPGTASAGDSSPVELGLKFRSDVAGMVTGVRFYKGTGNTGTHIGNLWSSAGTKLGTVTFSNETATGWQQALFASPVAISANTTYVVSYYAPNGNYAADGAFFANSGVDTPPLHALQNGVDGGNGVYLYASGGGFPNSTYNATNYWVDLTFVPGSATTYSISGTIAGGAGATVTLSGAGNGSTTADSSGNYSFGSLANGSYTVTPSKAGFTFTPVSQNVTVSGANVGNVNFTAAASGTLSISGTITGGGGASVALSGAATASTTADASGNYSFGSLTNGTYTVTPSKAGFTFTPVSQNVTVSGANVGNVNFTATGSGTLSISGTITGGGGATVALSGAATASTTADASGNYSFGGLGSGTYTVTPTKTGFTFTPQSQNVTLTSSNAIGVNFTATANALSLDVNVSQDQTAASTTVTSPPFSTARSNELVLAFIAADRISFLTKAAVSKVTGAGLTWVLVKRTNAQNGTAEIWRAFAASPLTNATVTATINQSVQSSITVMSFSGVDTSGTNGSGAIGAVGGGNSSRGAPSASLTTTRNNSWVFGVGADPDAATARTPAASQSLVHQKLATSIGDTFWVQMQNNPTAASGTAVKINDTAPATDHYNLAICAVQPAP